MTLDLTGTPAKPWKYDGSPESACVGNNGLIAKNVDFETTVSFVAPKGARSMTFMYSFARRDDSPADYIYEVIVAGTSNVIAEGPSSVVDETVTCASDCLYVSEGDVVQFRCWNDNNFQACNLDLVRFWGKATEIPSAAPSVTVGARRLADDEAKPTILSTIIASAPSPPPMSEKHDDKHDNNKNDSQMLGEEVKVDDKPGKKRDSSQMLREKVEVETSERLRPLLAIKLFLMMFNFCILLLVLYKKVVESYYI